MIKALTKNHLILDGVMNKPGTEVEINEKEIDVNRLVELDAIEVIEEEKKAPKKGKENPGE